MTKIEAGSQVRAGYYFNLGSWAIHPVPADGERLPGESGESWVSIPAILALILTPVLGLAFLMFLPFIGFYLTIEAALQKVARVFRHEARELAATMAPGWQPGEAHLTGKRAAEKEGAAQGAPADELAKLAQEIEERRNAKR